MGHPASLIPWPAAVLIVGGTVLLVVGGWRGVQRVAAPLCFALLVAAGVAAWFESVPSPGGGLPTDASRHTIAAVTTAVGTWGAITVGLVTVFSSGTKRRESGVTPLTPDSWLLTPPTSDEHGLLLLVLAGMIVAASASSLVLLFVALKLMAIAQHLLLWRQARSAEERDRVRDALTFQMAGSAMLLFGLAVVYGLTGTVWLGEQGTGVVSSTRPGDPSAAIAAESTPVPFSPAPAPATLAAVLILAGLSVWAALPPGHWPQPALLGISRTWTVCPQVVAPKVVAVLVIVRVVAPVLPGWSGRVDVAVALFAGMALVIGTAMAVAATGVRGLLAAAAQAHAGVWLAGLSVACWETAHPQHSLTVASGLPGGVSAALFCLCADGLALLGVFATLAYLARPDRPVTFAEDLTGLIRQERLAAGVLCVCLLSLTGVPPLPGFWGRLWVLMAAFSSRHASTLTGLYEPHFGFLLLAAVVALSMAAIAIAYVRLLATIVLDDPRGRQQPSGGRAALAAGAIIALVVTAVGLAPGILLREVQIDNGPAARIVPSPPRSVPDIEPEPEATAPGGGGQQGRAAVESGSFRPTAPNA